jgi:hypothetical protein
VGHLSRPDLVLDGGQLDDPRIEDGDGIAIQVEGAIAGREQVAAPIGVVAVHQRDDEAVAGEGVTYRRPLLRPT